jgi:hypothetical protein
VEMGLGLRAATHKILSYTDASMRAGQISVQYQGLLAFSNTFYAVGCNLDLPDTRADACCGARDRALVKAISAATKGGTRSSVKKLVAVIILTLAIPTSASIFLGSSAKARSKPRLRHAWVGPCRTRPCPENEVHRIGAANFRPPRLSSMN